jgi:hypothetical protein
MEDVELPVGWKEKLLALGPDLAYVLGALANEGQTQIKEARTSNHHSVMQDGLNMHLNLVFPMISRLPKLINSRFLLFVSPHLFMAASPKRRGAP